MNAFGQLAKLQIEGFKKKDFKESLGIYKAYYNPTEFNTTMAVSYANKKEVVGKGNPEAMYSFTNPSTFSFSLKLDGTGASVPDGHEPGRLDVDQNIEDFLKIVYVTNGDTHRPSFLTLSWGKSVVAAAVLQTLTINRKLFGSNGETLRAELVCTFRGFSEKELQDAKNKFQSPDMTHMRIVQQGDRLPLMCERIYGDARLYLQVARYNNLSNPRKLEPGQKIYFPPLIASKA